MGKQTGFLEYERVENKEIPVKVRIQGYEEFHAYSSVGTRREQGARCMNCGVPMCQSAIRLKGMVTGCPLHNLIPEWNDQIYAGHERHALSRLLKTSNFPEFTGRVCPALCEKACINGMDGEPVTVHDNELYIIETAFANGWIADEDGRVLIYYASSDTRMHVAESTIDKLIDYCMNTPADGLYTAASVETIKKLIEKNRSIR